MNLRDILQNKGTDVFKINPQASLRDAVKLMIHHNCGSLLVCQNEDVLGIISERDILRAQVGADLPLDTTPVAQSMNARIVCGHPEDDLAKAMGVMSQHRVRHLPVVNDGKTQGVVSMGDLVKAQHQQLTRENHFLMSYIQS